MRGDLGILFSVDKFLSKSSKCLYMNFEEGKEFSHSFLSMFLF